MSTDEFAHAGTSASDAQTGGAAAADSVGGALHDDAVDAGAEVQDEPVLAQNAASIEDKLEGIAAQTRLDLGDESDERYQEVLRQRLTDAGIDLTDDDVRSLAQRSASGGGAGV